VAAVRKGPTQEALRSADQRKRAAAADLVRRARTAFAHGDDERTADLLERAVVVDPNFAETYVMLARLYIRQGDGTLALAFLDKAAQVAPADPGPLAEIESLRGVAFEELGQPDAARQAYERALIHSPDNERARLGLARVGE
jgi:Tfp pilus assembly protein PilF